MIYSPPGSLVPLAGGLFAMGHDRGDSPVEDGEGPAHDVILAPFSIARHTVTNAEFAEFVLATAYQTDAERLGWSFVFAGTLGERASRFPAVVGTPWWRQVPDAFWAHPEGPGSTLHGRQDHPVVHVSWSDAVAYCSSSGTRLPTEAEWEYAARGGRKGCRYPWGDEAQPAPERRMNVYRGDFPRHSAGTAPVGAFAPNGFGLHEMTGNVWEWTADWFAPDYYAVSPRNDPCGPEAGSHRVIRGGSFLCHSSYCNRYRTDARSSSTPESSAANTGFRVARSRS